jgi:hypothetical protein
MKKFVSFLLLALVLVACVPAFADDQTATPAASAVVADSGAAAATAAMLPAHPAAVVAIPATVMPSLAALPTDKSVGSMLLWVIGGLFPWLGWLASEIMPFIPGKINGFLQGAVEIFKSITYNPDTKALTVQLNEMQAAIADLKAQQAASDSTAGTLGTTSASAVGV